MPRPLVIAHRGASHDAPENTLAAFRLAWEQGADAIEADLRLTADGHIVAFHDPTGRRTLGDPSAISRLTLRELRKRDAGSWKHARWSSERAPTLSEIAAGIPPHGQLVLELKENLVAELAQQLPPALARRCTLIAFDAETVAEARRQLPACRALWLHDDHARSRRRGARLGEWLVDCVHILGAHGVDLRFARTLNAAALAPLREAGLTIFTYTVNHLRSFARAANLGVDGITTDHPGRARQWFPLE